MAGMVPALYLRHLKMEKEMRTTMMLVLALAVLAACGGNGTSSPSSGDGGNGNSTSSTSSSGTSASGGGGGTTSSSGTGGSKVCGPTPEDPFGGDCKIGDKLECPKDRSTNDEFCSAWLAEGLDLCPPDGNKFTINEEGVRYNDCGYDLPNGEHYQLPNDCKDFVNGDTWVEVGSPENPFTIGAYPPWLAYGQLDYNAACAGGVDYCTSGTMSGNKIYWYRFLRDNTRSSEGEFSPDCKTITTKYYFPHDDTPYMESVFVHSF